MSTIMIVDDNPDLLPVMADLLELAGHKVATAQNIDDAMRLVQQHNPWVAVLDYHLAKQGEGLGMLDIIRTTPDLANMRVIMMSGLDRRKECLQKGADGFLQKPFDLEDLLSEIERLGSEMED